jgi:methionyl-tRNA synthetase
LPYANGHIHIGHLVEYIQTDIWVRFQKLRGHRCIYICADDTHGTAIMIRARQEGRSEEELIADMQRAHERDFAAFDIEFDNYGSTNSEENRALCEEIWGAIRKAGLVVEKDVEQLLRPEAGTFLADRFVKGTCPKCGARPAGDNCDKCGHTYSPDRADRSRSARSRGDARGAQGDRTCSSNSNSCTIPGRVDAVGRTPAAESRQLPQGALPARAAARLGHLAPGALLRLRDPRLARQLLVRLVRRPDRLHRLDTGQWCDRHGEKLRRLVAQSRDRNPPLHRQGHHLLPHAVLARHAQDGRLQLPTKVHIHGFLTVDGEKMSKSEGHVRPARPTSSISTRRTCGTTTPRSSPGWTTST